MMEKRIKRNVTLIFLSILVITLLGTCTQETTPVQTEIPSPHPAELTVAALQTENAELGTQVAEQNMVTQEPPAPAPTQAATETPTATATVSPTPGPIIAVPEDAQTAMHDAAPGYVFVLDPDLWAVENTADRSADFLVHQALAGCTINIAPETPPVGLLQYYPRILGRHGWLVAGYEETSFYTHKDIKLELSVVEDEDCILAQVDVLAEVLTEDEFNGAPARTPAVQPTQRPAPEGFTCDGALPPRLQVGDRALIVTGTLWLRSEARVDEETEIRFFQQYTPVEIILTDGPVCVEESVYWKVTVNELGEGGQTFTGWMAESGGEIYFLDVWYLGW